jgi:hypothetical protein
MRSRQPRRKFAAHGERPTQAREADSYFQVTYTAHRDFCCYLRAPLWLGTGEKCKTFPVRAPEQRRGENKKRLRAHFAGFSTSFGVDVRGCDVLFSLFSSSKFVSHARQIYGRCATRLGPLKYAGDEPFKLASGHETRTPPKEVNIIIEMGSWLVALAPSLYNYIDIILPRCLSGSSRSIRFISPHDYYILNSSSFLKHYAH